MWTIDIGGFLRRPAKRQRLEVDLVGFDGVKVHDLEGSAVVHLVGACEPDADAGAFG
jgi:hypothetical protein